MRGAVADRLPPLGVDLDPTVNRRTRHGDADITEAGAAASTLVVAAREDLEMARQIRGALGDGPWS